MQLGMIGLGRMGGNMVRRLARNGHRCVVFNRTPDAIKAVVGERVTGSTDLKQLVAQLEKPRAVWVMLPAGEITEAAITQLGELLERGRHHHRRRQRLLQGRHQAGKVPEGQRHSLHRLRHERRRLGPRSRLLPDDRGRQGSGRSPRSDLQDAGSRRRRHRRSRPDRKGRDPRVERGYMHCGPSGAGRFVKMIHNGIEYGLMQAYAEGFNILHGAASEELPEDQRYQLDLPDIAELWRRGSVIGSWLLDLTAMALAQDPKLSGYSGFVEDSGEGRWTVMAAIEEAVPADVLSAALYARFRSREKASVSDKLLSAMRHGFGGHVEPKADQ